MMIIHKPDFLQNMPLSEYGVTDEGTRYLKKLPMYRVKVIAFTKTEYCSEVIGDNELFKTEQTSGWVETLNIPEGFQRRD